MRCMRAESSGGMSGPHICDHGSLCSRFTFASISESAAEKLERAADSSAMGT